MAKTDNPTTPKTTGPLSFLKSPSEGQALLLSQIMNLGGGIAAGVGAGKQSDKDRKAELEAQLRQNIQQAQMMGAQSMENVAQSQAQDKLSRDKLALDSTQLDPLAQQKSRAGFSLQGDKVRGWTPTSFSMDPDSGMGSFSGGFNALRPSEATKAMYSPEAAASAEMQDFRTPLALANPNIPIPDLTQVGLPNTKASNAAELFRKGVFDQQEQDRRMEKDAVTRAFQNIADSNQGQLQASQAQPEEHHSSIWKKLAKVGLIAGGGIATAMTGGALAPLIGAATGFGSGAIDGGLKGGLMGAGMGALTGGIGGGGAAAGVKQGLGSAVKSTLSNPKNLLNMGGAAVGGAPGAAMQLASGLVRGPQAPMAPHADLAAPPQFSSGPRFAQSEGGSYYDPNQFGNLPQFGGTPKPKKQVNFLG